MTALVVACGHGRSARPGSSAAPPVPTLPPGLSQPFALLHLQQSDAVSNALNAYAERCAERQGFTVRHDRMDSTGGFIVTLRDFGDMTDAEARAKGLHPGLPITHSESSRPTVAALDALDHCRQAAERRLGSSYEALDNRVADLTNQMSDAYHSAINPKLFAADRAEARCVVDRGWKPARPHDVGSEDVSAYEVFGVPPGQTVSDAATGMQTYLPSPREVDLALALLHCRKDLGLPEQLLAAAKAAQLPIVGRFEQQILQLNSDIDAMARTAASVLQ